MQSVTANLLRLFVMLLLSFKVFIYYQQPIKRDSTICIICFTYLLSHIKVCYHSYQILTCVNISQCVDFFQRHTVPWQFCVKQNWLLSCTDSYLKLSTLCLHPEILSICLYSRCLPSWPLPISPPNGFGLGLAIQFI